MQENPDLKLTIEGHVSDNGNADQAMTLSTSRAEAVKDYLVSQGVSADRITTTGFGATQPISTTKSKNMRIELKLSNQ
jgi:outer membrane protein OmpA-like peptidoglycan-associated protein